MILYNRGTYPIGKQVSWYKASNCTTLYSEYSLNEYTTEYTTYISHSLARCSVKKEKLHTWNYTLIEEKSKTEYEGKLNARSESKLTQWIIFIILSLYGG